MYNYGPTESGIPVCLPVSAFFSISVCICLCVSVSFSFWVCGYMYGYVSCVSIIIFLLFSLSVLGVSVCFCLFLSLCLSLPLPVSVCFSLSHKLFSLTCLFPSLLLPCAHDQTWLLLTSLYDVFQFTYPTDRPSAQNSNSKFWGKRIWLAQLRPGVNFWFNSTLARKVWSKSREVSAAVKWVYANSSAEH